MGRKRQTTAILLAAAVALAAAGSGTGAAQPFRGSLAGRLLVAAEELRDPGFARSVIYLVRHDQAGAMGLIVNRPMREVPAAELLESLGLEGRGVAGGIRLHSGGPVEPTRGFVLHTPDYQGPGTLPAGPGLALTVDAEILRDIGLGRGPRRALVALGYAGWAPGQLEGEMARGSWISVPADEGLIFEGPAEGRWGRAMARRLFPI